MEGYHIVVVGIGAMGGGMARNLLSSSITAQVTGYDMRKDSTERFFSDSLRLNKAPTSPPSSLSDAIEGKTEFVVLSLVNEAQCDQVCFKDEKNLLNLMPTRSCVILTSTVTGMLPTAALLVFVVFLLSLTSLPWS